MKRICFLSVFLFFAAIFAYAAQMKIIIKNYTGYEVTEAYVYPADSKDWGKNYLAGTSIDDDESITVTLDVSSNKNRYDVRIRDVDGAYYVYKNVLIKNNISLEIGFEELDIQF